MVPKDDERIRRSVDRVNPDSCRTRTSVNALRTPIPERIFSADPGVWGLRPPRGCVRVRRPYWMLRSQSTRSFGPASGPACRGGGSGGGVAPPPLGPGKVRHTTDRAERDPSCLGPSQVRESAGCSGLICGTQIDPVTAPPCSGLHGCSQHYWPANRATRPEAPGALHTERRHRKVNADTTPSDSSLGKPHGGDGVHQAATESGHPRQKAKNP